MRFPCHCKLSVCAFLACFFFMAVFLSLIFFMDAHYLNFHHLLPLTLIAIMLPVILYLLYRVLLEKENLAHEERESRLQLEQSAQLIKSLEAQRHDFRNQLQVIWGLAAMGRVQEIKEYIEEYGAVLNSATELNRIANTVVQALLLAFQCKARELGVAFTVDCRTDLAEFHYPPLGVSRVISALLQDTAEAAIVGADSPAVRVALWRERDSFCFSFWNNGPGIPPGGQDRIFPPGTGAGAAERKGQGLQTVRTLTREMGGAISVRCDETGTTFCLRFPYRRPSGVRKAPHARRRAG